MNATPKTALDPLSQKWRIVSLTINILIPWIIYYFSTQTIIPTGSGASIWLLAVIAYWILAEIDTPFFSPPKDSLITAISVILLLAPIDFSPLEQHQAFTIGLNYFTIGLSFLVVLFALIAIFFDKTDYPRLNPVSYRLSNALGKGEVLYTLVVLISIIGFYQFSLGWTLAVCAMWTVMVVSKPVNLLLRIGLYLVGYKKPLEIGSSVGTILRIDTPDIIRVVLNNNASTWLPDSVHIAHMKDAKATYVLPLFFQVQNEEIIGTGLCCPDEGEISTIGTIGNVYAYKEEGLSLRLLKKLNGNTENAQIAGIVVEGSSIAHIRFQVVRKTILEEGSVVFLFIRGKKVYYQVLDANTNEENFQQNPYGVQIVVATQLGSFDKRRGFEKFPWLPDMNQPLFLANEEAVEQELDADEFIIGKIPGTAFGLPVNLTDLITHHTAVLGVTGTGKTELVLDIIRNALERDVKVFCVDFTGDYKLRLADCDPQLIGLNVEQGTEFGKRLFAVETGTYGAPAEKAALKAFLDAIAPEITNQIDAFLQSDKHLGIFELSEIINTKATLRTTELYLSAIMNWAKKNRGAEKIMIVLEEAHTIIPESFNSGFDSDTQWVVSRIGQIALQGRKYGVGLTIVSQRTALVSKTILSQCNTYFTHSLVDKTSLDYLSGVYSQEHVHIIPNLRFLEFLAYGKAVLSERPLLVKRDFDEEKLAASQKLNSTAKVTGSDKF